MSYLTALPRSTDSQPPQRAVTVVSHEAREVVYLDQSASIEIITEALKAWGLRVRAERTDSRETAKDAARSAPLPDNWETTRPESKAPTRLDNVLSPLWLPILERSTNANEPVAAWAWFSRAA